MIGSSPHTRGALGFGRVRRRRQRIIPAYAGSTRPDGCRRTGAPDHPRIRGEHVNLRGVPFHFVGSSPHTRGAPACATSAPRHSRIIPAYAGSTHPSTPRTRNMRDHPRIRGEHRNLRFPAIARIGSSPHTRGARYSPSSCRPARRIIPAYAGSTSFSIPCHGRLRDHPRIRGEHAARKSSLRMSPGSSPHTRGALAAAAAGAGAPRIIPAYAGSTWAAVGGGRGMSDHPRIRGEHGSRAVRRPSRAGSSPHTRGALKSTSTAPETSEDHPRIRGEHAAAGVPSATACGSSPHTRGAPCSDGDCFDLVGIIPAYAGSTSVGCPPTVALADHPRIRGEHCSTGVTGAFDRGSSPHTRGARDHNVLFPARLGIIPAYAGSTDLHIGL